MKIKKSTFENIIREEVEAIINESGWDAFKQGVLRGITKKPDSWYSKFAKGFSLPSQSKRVVDRVDDLISVVKNISDPPKLTLCLEIQIKQKNI